MHRWRIEKVVGVGERFALRAERRRSTPKRVHRIRVLSQVGNSPQYTLVQRAELQHLTDALVYLFLPGRAHSILDRERFHRGSSLV